MPLVNCCLSELGQLAPAEFLPQDIEKTISGHMVVNGVSLPPHVLDELRQLGIPLAGYSSGELHDAIIACAYDRNLVDDPDGLHFRDKLTLTHEEKIRRERMNPATLHGDDEETPCGPRHYS